MAETVATVVPAGQPPPDDMVWHHLVAREGAHLLRCNPKTKAPRELSGRTVIPPEDSFRDILDGVAPDRAVWVGLGELHRGLATAVLLEQRLSRSGDRGLACPSPRV